MEGSITCMYQPIFDDNINDDELSPLENFISLNDLILAGGIKAERARKILNQFTSKSSNKSDESSLGGNSTQILKKPKYQNTRRFKNY